MKYWSRLRPPCWALALIDGHWSAGMEPRRWQKWQDGMETKERTEPAHQVHKRQGLTSPLHLPTPPPLLPHSPTQSSVNHSVSLLWFIMCTHTPRTLQSSWAALSYYDLSASIFAFRVMRDWIWVMRRLRRGVCSVVHPEDCLSWIATAANCVLSSLFTFRKRSAFSGEWENPAQGCENHSLFLLSVLMWRDKPQTDLRCKILQV